MASTVRIPAPSGHIAITLTAAAVPLAGRTAHSIAHRRLAAAQQAVTAA
jgi:hypothetical protein